MSGRGSVWWRVAWRSLWRNRSRTLITASALAFGYLAAVVMVGLDDGMSAELVENGTRLMSGQMQVHAVDYLPDRNMQNTIGGDDGTNVDSLLARIDADPDVVASAPRLYGGGLVSAGERTEAGLLMGIDPRREEKVTTLLSTLDGGRVPRPGAHEVVLGSEMARQLQVKLGDQLVLVAPAADGSLGNDLYTLVGIFHTGTREIDASFALLPLTDLQGLLAMGPRRIHEVAVDVTRPRDIDAVAAGLGRRLAGSGPPVEVRSWRELRPDLAQSVDLMNAWNSLIVLIVFGMAVFGVANTLIIGTFERRKEFAVVRALGTTPLGVGRTVVYEGIMLGALALVAGALVTAPIMWWWHNAPPDLSSVVGSFSWSGSQWRPILRVEYSLRTPIVSALALFLTSIVAAIYPAWRATRVPPADALADR